MTTKEERFYILVNKIVKVINNKLSIDITPQDIIFFDNSKLLASCDSKNRVLCINKKVLNDNVYYQKYAILYELAHFKYLKHDYRFRMFLDDLQEIIYGKSIFIL